MYNFKREREEKDATIEELTGLLNSSELANSKRIAELEEIIRRKNTIITKLRKDMVVLEQKVVHLSRLRRPSFSASDSYNDQPRHMRDNLVYDMDSTTSPSSSDSDSVPANRPQVPATKIDESKSQSASPLKEKSRNWKSNMVSSSGQKQLSARGDLKKNRRRSLLASNTASPKTRWA
ncbi:Inactive rhomboid protein [Quillaja saponaria]|uniref:Inactive rhomboid protein n=1 Tax=Quillaja saponaria TaxID=32244 RepID=A0AAD7QFW4_QUISA|nr:Inactive rhomboid protein [Quillaja saponaria]